MTENSSFRPRFLTATQYIFALHRPVDHIAILVRNRDRQQTTQRILAAESAASTKFQSWLVEQNRTGADIFIGMNPVSAEARRRTKENVKEIRHAYLDLDEEAGASLQKIRTSREVPPPNFVLDTSPGKHQVIWRVQSLDREQAELLLRALASQYGGDPAAIDISRMLRLPGFANRKYNEAFVVRAHHEIERIHELHDFRVQDASHEAPRQFSESHSAARMIPSGHRSQSEADWAYAMRALSRGDDPETVVTRIAHFRAEDKPNPEYYARLTVKKAQIELARDRKDVTFDRTT